MHNHILWAAYCVFVSPWKFLFFTNSQWLKPLDFIFRSSNTPDIRFSGDPVRLFFLSLFPVPLCFLLNSIFFIVILVILFLIRGDYRQIIVVEKHRNLTGPRPFSRLLPYRQLCSNFFDIFREEFTVNAWLVSITFETSNILFCMFLWASVCFNQQRVLLYLYQIKSIPHKWILS